jgi:hypothetical protein
MARKSNELREEARRCVQVADQTADDKVAAALLAYACTLEQRARLIEGTKKRTPVIALSADQVGTRTA